MLENWFIYQIDRELTNHFDILLCLEGSFEIHTFSKCSRRHTLSHMLRINTYIWVHVRKTNRSGEQNICQNVQDQSTASRLIYSA